jgi:ribosome biogenesis GTPase A
MSETSIQWYPGHMARAMRRFREDVRMVDAVIETVDARAPLTSANPMLTRLAGGKPGVLVLTHADLADLTATCGWITFYRESGRSVLAVDARSRGDVLKLRAELAGFLTARGGRRAMVAGIPNTGKSTVINALIGRRVARTADRAGVTRAVQWFRLAPGIELLDTAGILPPKIEGPEAQWKLALVGAVPRARFDPEEIVARLVRWAGDHEYRLPDLETFAQSRGFVRRGTMADTHNAAWSYLKDWNDGKFGRMTLEEPPAR